MAENPALDEFISRWQKICEELKRQAIDLDGSLPLYHQLEGEKITFQFNHSVQEGTEEELEYIHKFAQLGGDLKLARTIANANYKKQNPSKMNKFFDRILSILDNLTATIRRLVGG